MWKQVRNLAFPPWSVSSWNTNLKSVDPEKVWRERVELGGWEHHILVKTYIVFFLMVVGKMYLYLNGWMGEREMWPLMGAFELNKNHPPLVTSNNAIPYHTTPCITIPFLVLPYHSLYYYTILFNTMQNSPPCNLRSPNIVTSNSSNQERGDGTNLERIQMTKNPKHKIKEFRYPKTIQRGPQVIFVQPAYKWCKRTPTQPTNPWESDDCRSESESAENSRLPLSIGVFVCLVFVCIVLRCSYLQLPIVSSVRSSI